MEKMQNTGKSYFVLKILSVEKKAPLMVKPIPPFKKKCFYL